MAGDRFWLSVFCPCFGSLGRADGWTPLRGLHGDPGIVARSSRPTLTADSDTAQHGQAAAGNPASLSMAVTGACVAGIGYSHFRRRKPDGNR
jgi:hypothetical protein